MQHQKISVIGLGQMGLKIATMFVAQQYKVTVWNRTLSKAREVSGAAVADSPAAAIAASPVIVICVYDNTALEEILQSITDHAVFNGKIIINFTTGTPAEAAALESRLAAPGAQYLNGAIQVAPDQMGLPETTILLSGSNEAYQAVKDILAVLGGNVKHLDHKAAASSAMDLATLSWLYGSYVGMLYGVLLAREAGIKLELYGELLSEISPGFIDFFKHDISKIEKDDYEITQSPLSISVTATQRIADAVRTVNGAPAFTDTMAGLLKKADEAGYSRQELAALIKVIQQGR